MKHFFPFIVSVKKCGGSCNTIDDPYAQVFVPNKLKKVNLRVFNWIAGVNDARFLVQNESFECKCGLNESICISKQKWDHDDCQCECKELDDWGSCEKRYLWNPSTCGCDSNKVSKIDENVDTKNCSCEKRLIVKLALVCEDELLNTTKTSVDE